MNNHLFLSNRSLILMSTFLFFGSMAFGQSNPHMELDWFTIETEHFNVHFHEGAERTARVVAKIAEEVYEPITSLYDYEPGRKYDFVIRDHDDYSNGAAYFYDDKLEIWATAMDFELRGTHNWLRNVITHEFVHMIQMQSSMKVTKRIPAFYFQAIGYEEDRREDVLHGGPNVIASYPLAMNVIPVWFAEGVAQYQVPGLAYDTWDAHRDMILRTAALDDKLLSFGEMGVFGDNTLRNEKAYNHGYAFVGYLAKNHGLNTLRDITGNMRGFSRWTIDGAMKKATGKEAGALYKDWKTSLEEDYKTSTVKIRENKVEGEFLQKKGSANFSPTWSPDGRYLAYITNGSSNSFYNSKLVYRDETTGKEKTIDRRVRFSLSWSPDGNQIAYAQNNELSDNKKRFYDLYTYDLPTGKKTRRTEALRAHSPDWSPDGEHLIFVMAKDGTDNLAIMDLASGKIDSITAFHYGEQVYNPRFSPDGESILFAKSTANGQDILLKNLQTGYVTPLVDDIHDSRDAIFSVNGDKIYFAWDKTGIFNIYSKDLSTGQVELLTNVLGGAFMPSMTKDGTLAFSHFTSDGYKISAIENIKSLNEENARYHEERQMKLASAGNSYPQAMIDKIKDYDDSQLPAYDVSKYSNSYSPVAFMPRVMIDYGTVKVGSYFYSFDVLGKYGFLAGFDFNKRGDYDIFALVDYNTPGPRLFLEAYNQVQNTSPPLAPEEIELRRGNNFPDPEAEDKFNYNLLEVDIGASIKPTENSELSGAFIISRYAGKIRTQDASGFLTIRYDYFTGRDFRLKYAYNTLSLFDSNPVGRYFELRFDREYNKFLNGFAVDERFVDGFGEVFDNYNYNKYMLHWKEFWPLPIKDHTINLETQAGFIDTEVDSFFNFFAGGILGNRGYSYFSMEGRKMLLGRLTYRLPLLKNIDLRLLHLYFDKVYLGLFYDYGDAFNGGLNGFRDFKSSVGFQLRMDANSFYSFPTRVFMNAAYGLDEHENGDVIYGKEWRFYFGVSFGYIDN
jgi:Tol biopolymer transport system component